MAAIIYTVDDCNLVQGDLFRETERKAEQQKSFESLSFVKHINTTIITTITNTINYTTITTTTTIAITTTTTTNTDTPLLLLLLRIQQ